MRYKISGKQIDIGDALQKHVKDELEAIAAKYAERPTTAQIVFSKDAFEYQCEIEMHLSTGVNSISKGKATDIYAAFDQAAERLEKQLRRYKRRLKNHHKEKESVALSAASAYILAAPETPEDEEAEAPAGEPIIIAEIETRIPSLSVGEAVMQMELAGANILVFRNEGGENINVVYRRQDGNIGWIDTANSK